VSENQAPKPEHKIVLATGVGFDVSAHRLTGVHYGDLLRFVQRNQGETREYAAGPKTALNMVLWQDALYQWSGCNGNPTRKYSLRIDLLKNDYKIQFSLLFRALQREGVKIPVVAAIGCGVFGWAFGPIYQQMVAEAYKEVLASDNFGFDCVILAEISNRNVATFNTVFSKADDLKMKVPLIIAQHDILEVARLIATKYPTSIHNAGDLWEFGQFFEGGGSLEEYVARMTTGYLSQHFLLNPSVINMLNYVLIRVEDLGIDLTPGYFTDLRDFVEELRNWKDYDQ